jgi:ABC-type Fe3+ transport system substrate-binding protein
VIAALLAGERAIALTNSDRAFAAQGKQPTLVVSVPDQAEGGLGALLIPAVIGITQRGIDRPACHRLVEFLLAPSAARRISLTDDSILVLSDPGEVPAGLLSILKLRVMPVVYAALAARLPGLASALAQAGS